MRRIGEEINYVSNVDVWEMATHRHPDFSRALRKLCNQPGTRRGWRAWKIAIKRMEIEVRAPRVNGAVSDG